MGPKRPGIYGRDNDHWRRLPAANVFPPRFSQDGTASVSAVRVHGDESDGLGGYADRDPYSVARENPPMLRWSCVLWAEKGEACSYS